MKIGFVKVFVTDLKRSLDYYTRVLGMELDYTDGKKWAQFKSGEDVRLAIEVSDDRHLVGRYVGVTLMVDDIAEAHGRLTAKGVAFTRTPQKQPWGGTLADFTDLDGNVLTLMEAAPA